MNNVFFLGGGNGFFGGSSERFLDLKQVGKNYLEGDIYLGLLSAHVFFLLPFLVARSCGPFLATEN